MSESEVEISENEVRRWGVSILPELYRSLLYNRKKLIIDEKKVDWKKEGF